jgi:hypothetical protein
VPSVGRGWLPPRVRTLLRLQGHATVSGVPGAPLCSRHVWSRPSLLRCQRDQARLFDPARSSRPDIAPGWNVAPTDPLPVVRLDPRAGERSLDVMRWGLVPFWAKDIRVGFANINAKAEGIEDRPASREAFQRRRSLVPVDNYYEWKKTANGKQPYAFALADRGLQSGWGRRLSTRASSRPYSRLTRPRKWYVGG